ncbi:MAG TPA: hypothetical protein VF444_01110 [Pseudonocardiaceae bacterium]
MQPDAEFGSLTSTDNGSDPVSEEIDHAQEFTEYAKAARGTAIKNHTKGDLFGEKLANRRADVYEKAAELVREYPLEVAASAMMEQAKANHVRIPPLVNFDEAGQQYVAAMAWQFCAWQIDKGLPEAAPSWD